jgi:hypothetical protein
MSHNNESNKPVEPDGSPGEQAGENDAMKHFKKFGLSLFEQCTFANQNVIPISLFADPDLDGLTAMRALARAIKMAYNNLDVACYHLPNGKHSTANALDDFISMQQRAHGVFVFIDIVPTDEGNSHMELPTCLDKSQVFLIDHHPKSVLGGRLKENWHICDSHGFASSGMIYHMLDQILKIHSFVVIEAWQQKWRKYLSIANYTDLGYKSNVIEKKDDSRIRLLGHVATHDAEMVSKADDRPRYASCNEPMALAVKYKLFAWEQITNDIHVDRGSGEVFRMDAKFTEASPSDFECNPPNADAIEYAFQLCMEVYKSPLSWKKVNAEMQDTTLVDTDKAYTIATCKDVPFKLISALSSPFLNPYLIQAIVDTAILPFQMYMVKGQPNSEFNNMNPEYADLVVKNNEPYVKERHIWLLYLEIENKAANIRKLGGTWSCIDFASQYTGQGHVYAAGCGGLSIKLENDQWSIGKEVK